MSEPPIPADPSGLPWLKDERFFRQDMTRWLEVREVLPADCLNVSPSDLVAQWRFLQRGNVRFVLAQDGILIDCRVNKLVIVRIVFLRVHAVRRQMIDPQALDPSPADPHRVCYASHAWT